MNNARRILWAIKNSQLQILKLKKKVILNVRIIFVIQIQYSLCVTKILSAKTQTRILRLFKMVCKTFINVLKESV